MEQVEFNVVAGTNPLIEEKYGHPVDLLDNLGLYYPKYSEHIKINEFHYVGKGADAYVFNIGERVFKFTQNEAHAQVAKQILEDNITYPNLVTIHDVTELPLIGMFLIQEEYLYDLPEELAEDLYNWFSGNEHLVPEAVEAQLDLMISSFGLLEVEGWSKDCFVEHNILYDPKSEKLKLFDFGYTQCKNSTPIPEVI